MSNACFIPSRLESEGMHLEAVEAYESIFPYKEGYNVTAVELVESNLEVLKNNSVGIENIISYQGDALNEAIYILSF